MIPANAFNSAEGFTAITLPSTLKTINEAAFYTCSSLTAINIDSDVDTIADNAFDNYNDDLTIYGVAGTRAETYANEKGIRFSTRAMPETTVKISGKVIKNDAAPITGVTVTLWLDGYTGGTPIVVSTNRNGIWSYDKVKAGHDYLVTFEKEGYVFSKTELTVHINDVDTSVRNIIGELEREDGNTLNGSILSALGQGVRDVKVRLYDSDANNARLLGSAVTDSTGSWSMTGLPVCEDASLVYSASNYRIVDNSTSVDVIGETTLSPVIAELIAAGPSKDISFTMMTDTGTNVIEAGSEITFTVNAPNTYLVQLIVDGIAYEQYALTNGTATFKRVFSASGVRSVQFQPHTLGGWGQPSEAQKLNVTSAGSMNAPVISPINIQVMRQGFTLSWEKVEHADTYTVYVYHNDTQVWPGDSDPWASRTSELSIPIPGDVLLERGKYAVNVVTTGRNYNSSTGHASFEVRGYSDVVDIVAPPDGGIYNISDMMYPTVVCYKRGMHTKLAVTDPNGETKTYTPDSLGVCYITAAIVGTYQMKAYASSNAEFDIADAEAESSLITVTVNPPEISKVKDIWDNKYGAVFTQNKVTVKAECNCLGDVEAFIDGVSQGTINANVGDPYGYTYIVGDLSEGKHNIGFKASYNGFTSELVSIPVFSIRELPSGEQVPKFMSKAGFMPYYPESDEGKSLAYGTRLTILGTWEQDYAYVKYDKWYGFVLKSLLVDKLTIARIEAEAQISIPDDETETESPEPVSEVEFRKWAADVIYDYYYNYAMHGSKTHGENYKKFSFKFLHPVRDFFWRWGDDYANIDLQTIGQFDGLYREYYFLSLYKMDYDFNDTKDSFTVNRKDNETDAQYEARMLPFYKSLLIDTMKEKAKIDPTSFDRLETASRGLYTLKLDKTTGKMTMQLDEKGVMGNLEKMADNEAGQAWAQFGTDMLKTALDTAVAYTDVVAKGGTNSYLKSLEEATIKAATAMLSKWSKTEFDNALNQLENNLYTIIEAEIANASLRDYNRIINYLSNIYARKDNAFVDYLTDPVFEKAVNSLLDVARDQRFSKSEAYAKQQMQKWFMNGVQLNRVLSRQEIKKILAEELINQLVNVAISPLKAFQKEAFKGTSVGKAQCAVIANMSADAAKVLITQWIQTEIKSIEVGKDVDLDLEELILNFYQKICDGYYDNLEKVVTDDFDKYDTSDMRVKMIVDLLKIIIGKMKRIYDVVKKVNASGFNNTGWQSIKNLFIEIIGDVASTYWKNFGNIDMIAIASRLNSATFVSDAADIKTLTDTVVGLKNDIISTADSLAKAVNATLKDMEDEKQMSYRAVAMVSAYKGSSPIERDLKARLDNLTARMKKDLRASVLDTKTSVNDILYITNAIMMQSEYDIVGCQWLVDILEQGEAKKGNPTFYRHIHEQIEGTIWEQRITYKIALTEHRAMVNFHDLWLAGWKEEYRSLSS